MNNRLSSRGLVIMAFPCNQFASQEPKSLPEIKKFAEDNYNVTFPMFEKIDVNGPNTHPVFAFLKSAYPNDIPWNFLGKFLIDRDGIPVGRFQKEPHTEIEKFIESILDETEQTRSARRSALEKENGAGAAPTANM